MNALAIVQLTFACLVLAALLAFRYRPGISRFELERLSQTESNRKKQLKFLKIYPGMRILIYVLSLIMMIIISAITMFSWGFLGSLLAFALIILAFFLSRAFHKIVTELIEKNFGWFNKYFAWAEPLGKIVIAGEEPKIHSKHELAHLIETGDFMEMADKMLMLGALKFTDLNVGDVMVKKDDIVSVKSSDVVGPKLLDELHQSGHAIFPVMEAKTIVGMLHVEDIIAFERGNESVTKRIRHIPTTIHETASLEEALLAMRDNYTCVLLVVNDNDKLIGMIDISCIANILLNTQNSEVVIE